MSGNWEEDSEYGFYAEIEIAKIFESKGYSVEFAEYYAGFNEGMFYGPRISVLPPGNYESIESAEVAYVQYIAPDLKVSKNKKTRYFEIKRRGKFSRFNGEDVVYIDRTQFYDYCYLTDYGYDIYLMLYVDEFSNDHFYSANIDVLYNNIQYQTSKFVSFNKRVFDVVKR